MAAEILRNAGFWLREYDLQGSMNRASIEMTSEAKECTTFGSTSRTYAVDLPRIPFSIAGYVADTAAGLALFTLAGLRDLPMTMAKAKTVGAVAFTGKVLDGQFNQTWSVSEVNTFESSGELVERSCGRGYIMHLGTAVAATGTGAVTLMRAITLNKKAFATLHVTAFTGTPTFTGRIESDDAIGFTTPVTRATFASLAPVTVALGSEIVEMSGPITDTFWRFAWTITGTGTVTFAVALGFEEPF